MKVNSVGVNPSFGRKPNQAEMKVYTNSVNKGLNLLGKQVDIILHNASAPAVRSENTGIGSLFSRTVKEKFIPFLKEHGFSHIQQEPNGLRKAADNSPYAPEADTKNIFLIPLEKLVSEKLLSKETFDNIVKNNPNPERVNYPYVRENYDKALREAFENSKKNTLYKEEFAKFKLENEAKYEQSAIFRLISSENNNRSWEEWQGVDKTLYVNPQSEASKSRISELKEKYANDYDLYLFEQMLVEKENAISNKLAAESGISIIGDSPVASSAVEEWVNQKLFLKNKALGCPPDYFSPDGQRWGFKYYNPDKIFNKDGSLGEAGEVLKKKYENYFASFPGGMRIDHVIGLVDPFIYTVGAKKMTPENSGRIYSAFESKYKKKNDEEYAAILNKIVLPAAKKYGHDISSIICEDLGEVTPPVQRVMKKLGLGGISVTQFDYRGSKAPEKNTIMPGSHDNSSFLEFVDGLFSNKDKRFMTKTRFLAEDTAAKDISNEDKKKYLNEIRTDKKKFISASFTELFASPAKRIQIFFTDVFGIAKTYNRPGTNEGCWELRLGEKFEDEYYKAVAEGKAPNFAKAIADALRHRGLDKEHPDLMKDLDNSAKIIGE